MKNECVCWCVLTDLTDSDWDNAAFALGLIRVEAGLLSI